MYGLLAACIVGMAMFLGLFAISVETGTAERQDKLIIERVQTIASAPETAK
ncbi:MAG: hypothetical protein KTR19_05235 [Hyphomicrobiales bacterium]|nr:hypothetical protein [Hyphomicrobiales bacterium]